jgi:hypothetical protein
MRRILFSPSTNPTAAPPPDPLLVFIQQAQLTLVYGSPKQDPATASQRVFSSSDRAA